MPREPSKPKPFTASLAKGLRVLQCFSPVHPELSASEIARLTDLPQPTVWRLCQTLIELGFLIVPRGRRTMRPGIPLLGLGHAVLADLPIAELALPDMRAIAERHEGAVSLGARDGLNMIYLQRCQGSAIVRADLKVGSRVPMATSATGWAYLAGVKAAERDQLLSELAAAHGADWERIEPRLLDALAAFEAHGFIVNEGLMHARINSVAVPVRSPDRSVLLSLSSGGIETHFQQPALARIGADLKSLAAKLGPLLSYRSPE